jgi:hypothetical protein
MRMPENDDVAGASTPAESTPHPTPAPRGDAAQAPQQPDVIALEEARRGIFVMPVQSAVPINIVDQVGGLPAPELMTAGPPLPAAEPAAPTSPAPAQDGE